MEILNISPEFISTQLGSLIGQITALQAALAIPSNAHPTPGQTDQTPDDNSKELLKQIELQIGTRRKSFDLNIERMVEKKKERLNSEVKSIQPEVFKVVFTGGPCAGKTTAITKLVDNLRDKGYTTFVVPEAATIIFQSGGNLNLATYTSEMKVKFQFFLMMIQMSLEDCLLGIARNTDPTGNVVLLCDRGTMDGRAYLEKQLWEQILNDYDLNLQRIRDQRYDLVIHISTAAFGAEDFYSDKTNSARHESLEFARFIDRNLEEAWIDHPHFVQINNKAFANFDEKIAAVINTVYKYLGIETSLDFYNKYLVANPQDQLAELLEAIPDIKVHTYRITDILFFKDEKKQELTYFRKRVSLSARQKLCVVHQMC